MSILPATFGRIVGAAFGSPLSETPPLVSFSPPRSRIQQRSWRWPVPPRNPRQQSEHHLHSGRRLLPCPGAGHMGRRRPAGRRGLHRVRCNGAGFSRTVLVVRGPFFAFPHPIPRRPRCRRRSHAARAAAENGGRVCAFATANLACVAPLYFGGDTDAAASPALRLMLLNVNSDSGDPAQSATRMLRDPAFAACVRSTFMAARKGIEPHPHSANPDRLPRGAPAPTFGRV